jgi:hypothetical protein
MHPFSGAVRCSSNNGPYSAFYGKWSTVGAAKIGLQEATVYWCRTPRLRATRRDFFMRLRHLLALALIGVPYICNAQTPADDVAAQIRSQGYRCDQPVAAKRDLSRSKPDSAVWVLNCRNATFRVRLDPNMAARITKLKNKS